MMPTRGTGGLPAAGSPFLGATTMAGGPINQKHFQNLQEKDQIIRELFQETQGMQEEIQALRRALHHRGVYDSFVTAGITGALSNPELFKAKAGEKEMTPLEVINAVAIMAVSCADATMKLCNEREIKRKEDHEKQVAAEQAKAEEAAKAKNAIPLLGADGKVIPVAPPEPASELTPDPVAS